MRNRLIIFLTVLIFPFTSFSQIDTFKIRIKSCKNNKFQASVNKLTIKEASYYDLKERVGKGKIEKDTKRKSNFPQKRIWVYYENFGFFFKKYLKEKPLINNNTGSFYKEKTNRLRCWKRNSIEYFWITSNSPIIIYTPGSIINVKLTITTFAEINSKIKSTNEFPKDRTLHYFSRKLSIEFENDELSPNYGKAIEIVIY